MIRGARPGPTSSDEPTRDLRRDVLRQLHAASPPVPRPPVPGPPPRRSRGRVVLIVAGALVGLLFLGVAGVGLYALVGPAGGAPAAEPAAGDCVAVAGADASGLGVEPAACGAPPANFRVVDTAGSAGGCPSDVDFSYTGTAGRTGGTTVCLDIDWATGDCFELSGAYPLRVDCAAPPGPQTVRVVEVDRTTAETAHCSSSSGLPYPQRRFVVCLDRV